MHLFSTTFTALSLVFASLFFSESAQFLYNQGRYREAREALTRIGTFNGVPAKEMEFVLEGEVDKKHSASASGPLAPSKRPKNQAGNDQDKPSNLQVEKPVPVSS